MIYIVYSYSMGFRGMQFNMFHAAFDFKIEAEAYAEHLAKIQSDKFAEFRANGYPHYGHEHRNFSVKGVKKSRSPLNKDTEV